MSSYRFLDNTQTPLLSQAFASTTKVIAGPVKTIDFQTFTFQAEWAASTNGTIAITGSLDGVSFRPFGVTVPTQPAGGGAGGVLIPLYGHGMKYLQLEYVPTSAAGSMVVTSLGKTR